VATREHEGETLTNEITESLHAALDRIEKRVSKLTADAKVSAVPAVKALAKEHFLVTLLLVLGLGFFLGKALAPRDRR
jgi:hypothetical protein